MAGDGISRLAGYLNSNSAGLRPVSAIRGPLARSVCQLSVIILTPAGQRPADSRHGAQPRAIK